MARGQPLRDPQWESYLYHRRIIVAAFFSVVLIVLLFMRLFDLQVINHQHYTTLSRNNRVEIQPIPPTRGLIYDRNGVLLAENIPTYSLDIVPERVHNMNHTLAEIRKLINVSDDDITSFREALKHVRRFEAVPLRFRLSDEEVARIAVNRYRLPGVEIKSTLSRYYPLGPLMAHTVGYVGRIDLQELQALDPSNYAGTTHIGKIGVEKTYEDILHGHVGYQQVEINARGRVLRVLQRTPPVPGRNLYLNIDVNLQRVAEQAFGNQYGALVAIDPTNGAVLALVSMPSFNPNLFVNGIDSKKYQALINSTSQPLFNRAVTGQYPPGSTVKPFYGLAGLESGEITPTTDFFCPGYFMLKGDSHRYRGWKTGGHGLIDLSHAIRESCDVFFYNLALKLGIDRMATFMHQFGFGQPTGIDLTGESSGLMPSRQWKRRIKHEPWFPGETLITGIGQGFTLTTPLQLASATATLAEFGKRMRPTVVEAVQNPITGKKYFPPPQPLPPVPVINMADWQRIHRAMISVVSAYNGTAHSISHDLTYQIAGKTGTAQVFGIKQDQVYNPEDIPKRLRDHALFIGFAPADNPRIAVAVLVQNGGGGGSVAAPIARKVMDAYLLGPDGKLKKDMQ